jgi:hypothetical protein
MAKATKKSTRKPASKKPTEKRPRQAAKTAAANFETACKTLSSLQEMETPLLELRGLAYGIWQMSHSIDDEDEKLAFIAMSDVIWDRVQIIDEAWHRGFPQLAGKVTP